MDLVGGGFEDIDDLADLGFDLFYLQQRIWRKNLYVEGCTPKNSASLFPVLGLPVPSNLAQAC